MKYGDNRDRGQLMAPSCNQGLKKVTPINNTNEPTIHQNNRNEPGAIQSSVVYTMPQLHKRKL